MKYKELEKKIKNKNQATQKWQTFYQRIKICFQLKKTNRWQDMKTEFYKSKRGKLRTQINFSNWKFGF